MLKSGKLKQKNAINNLKKTMPTKTRNTNLKIWPKSLRKSKSRELTMRKSES